jgi:predicted transposase/invertase (TIGR01784 family)
VLNTKEVNHKLSDDLEIHFVELPKWHKGNLCKLNSLERWLAYLSPDTTDEERRQLAMEDAAIGTAMKAEKVFLSNSDYLTAYERQQKYLRDMRAMKEAARDEGLEEGREAGYTEGREAGFTAGLAEGHAEGLAEGEAKAMKKSVLALHRKGKSDSEIAGLLELSLADVQAYLCQEEK